MPGKPPSSVRGFSIRVASPSGAVFGLLGAVSIVIGGLIAAVTSPLGWAHGAWAAAYLVLVTGAAQIALGIGQDHFTAGNVTARMGAAEMLGLNVGSIAVIVGTLAATPAVVDIGGALVLIALVLMLVAVREARLSAAVVIYRLIIVLLVLSIPIGLSLAYTNSGQA